MAGFFTKIKSPVASPTTQATKDVGLKKKDEPAAELTPLEKMLLNAGPLRRDGSDKFFGFENFGNTCYCNSIVQALFYSQLFRQSVVNYPTLPPSPSETPSETPNVTHPIVPVTIRPPLRPAPVNPQQKKGGKDAAKSKPGNTVTQAGTSGPSGVRPEDKPDTPEYKKKQAMIKGPILEVASENALSYGMEECTFTGLKDIFLAIQQSSSRTGVLSPQRFLEIFKRDNEMFRNSMHQDAHEFYGVVLNDVIANVESNARRTRERLEAARAGEDGPAASVEGALGPSFLHDAGNGYRTPATGWVHDIFEGLLTSETKCLTCETASQRDETFLDLSIDLEQHSSVTSCLRKFSAEEMLCERNKFHCDNCGGLQEAEKRMKVKRLPKILTLHLKRFKYTEDYSRLQKLFHRVVYPYHLRMFNTTDDADDQDRLYELYAVVVHIGGNAYHGHYVSIIKTQDRGWVLFDDEMVEPVDKHFVRNFFGDKPGMATAYVLFYQETTFEKFREEQERESMEEMEMAAAQAANVAQADAPLRRQATQPVPATPHLEQESLENLAHARTVPVLVESTPPTPTTELLPPLPKPLTNGAAVTARPAQAADEASTGSTPSRAEAKSKDELKREKKEREAADKAAKQLEKERGKEREKQSREELKKARDDFIRASQLRRQEQEGLFKALNASKKTAAHEEEARKKEENGNVSSNGAVTSHAMNFLDRSRRGGKSMSRKSFSFFNHKEKQSHHHPPEEAANGDAPEKQDKFKGRLSIGLGRKKSSNVLV
ncbi:putative ubiquitin carboxyl-terminal hydrolase creB [Escovopsis weberi]|uniref:Ubiquitin carboxyl-terminal hydrolase n=1 Tax=Escovopsis weberi TaxID=150374 RepID=A0A0N0RU49_ESCWE|nr:putative ubiquitin carboxyl-terminal hydrolase creB [Escovopsis weberi]